MKKVLIGLLAVIAVAASVFVGAVMLQPAHTHIERSVVAKGTPADVFPLINDYQAFVKWSPWSGLDPNQEVAFSTPSSGLDAWYTWDGNDDVGSGKMTTTDVVEGSKLVQKLEFFRPFEAQAVTTYAVVAEGEGTKITWGYDAENDFFGKMGVLFVDMDAALGGDFQKGLDALKPMVETAAAERVAAEQKAEEDRKAAEAAEAAAEGEGSEAADG